MENKYKKAFDNIIMLAGGADILKFMNIRVSLDNLNGLMNMGDNEAKKILDVVLHCSKLFDILGEERDEE